MPRLVVIKSFDGGVSFIPPLYSYYLDVLVDQVPAADSLVKEGLCFSSNPNDTSNLIITATTNHFGEPDILSYNSHDAGKTWSGPVRINDDVVGAMIQSTIWPGADLRQMELTLKYGGTGAI